MPNSPGESPLPASQCYLKFASLLPGPGVSGQSCALKPEVAVERRILNVNDAARYLGVSKSWLNKARVSGGGPEFVRLTPHRVGYEVATLDRWIVARRASSTSTPHPDLD